MFSSSDTVYLPARSVSTLSRSHPGEPDHCLLLLNIREAQRTVERGACRANSFCSFQRLVGTEMTRPLSASAKASAATLSESTQMKSGIDEVLMPARS